MFEAQASVAATDQSAYAKETSTSACEDNRVAMKPWTNKSLSFGIIGLLLVALGVAICFLRSTIFHQIIQKVSANIDQ